MAIGDAIALVGSLAALFGFLLAIILRKRNHLELSKVHCIQGDKFDRIDEESKAMDKDLNSLGKKTRNNYLGIEILKKENEHIKETTNRIDSNIAKLFNSQDEVKTILANIRVSVAEIAKNGQK